jgi:NAD(P)-dependent dehydrogenase (short-subunit alcohol dehydrogenase family)
VNAIAPGLIETGMTKPLLDEARARGMEAKIQRLNQLQRLGSPDEVARVVEFLASDDASYVHGQVLSVDGGMSASFPYIRAEDA